MKLLGSSQLEGVRCDGVKGHHNLWKEGGRVRTYLWADDILSMPGGVSVMEVIILIYLYNVNNSYVPSMRWKWRLPKLEFRCPDLTSSHVVFLLVQEVSTAIGQQ